MKVTEIQFQGEPVNYNGRAGWVPYSVLENEKSALEKKGLWWVPSAAVAEGEMTEEQADIALKGALQLIHSSPVCSKITYVGYDADNVPSRRYSVSCETAQGEKSFISFGKTEVLSKTGVQITQPYPEAKALQQCKDATSERVTHPSSIDWSIFETNVELLGHDLQLVTVFFSAQNGFGATFDYRAVCRVLPNGKIDSMSITEHR